MDKAEDEKDPSTRAKGFEKCPDRSETHVPLNENCHGNLKEESG